MSEKKNKIRRKAMRYYYDLAMLVWLSHKPPRWRFIKYRKWKKKKPQKPHMIRDMGRSKGDGRKQT